MKVGIRKAINSIGLVSCMYLSSISNGLADPTSPEGALSELPKYVKRLGTYLGYDLTISEDKMPMPPSPLLGNIATTLSNQQITLALYFGAFLTQQIVDQKSSFASINCTANAIFPDPNSDSNSGCPKNSTNPNSTTVASKTNEPNSIKANPIKEIVSNSLSTPDISFCTLVISECENGASLKPGSLAAKCCASKPRYQAAIAIHALGTLPTPKDLYEQLQENVLAQMNGGTLIDPLLYSTTISTQTKGSDNSSGTGGGGLVANTQAEEAENFIRYVTGALSPSKQISMETYRTYWKQATQTTDVVAQANAQNVLATYLAGMRMFVSQNSIAVGNLYAILAKRMPQQQSKNQTSEALNDYRMATRRLYDPTISSGNPQWVDSINTASSATVQKEIAILLSEINYQLYLNRQQEERVLLTNSIMLLQLGHLVEPQPPSPPNQ